MKCRNEAPVLELAKKKSFWCVLCLEMNANCCKIDLVAVWLTTQKMQARWYCKTMLILTVVIELEFINCTRSLVVHLSVNRGKVVVVVFFYILRPRNLLSVQRLFVFCLVALDPDLVYLTYSLGFSKKVYAFFAGPGRQSDSLMLWIIIFWSLLLKCD